MTVPLYPATVAGKPRRVSIPGDEPAPVPDTPAERLEVLLRELDAEKRAIQPQAPPCCPACGQGPREHPAAEALGRAGRAVSQAIRILGEEEKR